MDEIHIEEDAVDSAKTPHCPRCLEQMNPTVGAWWCSECRVAIRD